MNRTILTIMLMAVWMLSAAAQEVVYEYKGHALKYKVLDEEAKTCKVAMNQDADGVIEIPEKVSDGEKEYIVTSLGLGAFMLSTIQGIVIPNTVTMIDKGAFMGCEDLESINIPASVTSLGEDLFFSCKSLRNIGVEEENPMYCSEEGVLFNKNKSLLMAYPPADPRTEYDIPSSVTTIGDGAFGYSANLVSVTIPESVECLMGSCFNHCSGLVSLDIPEAVTSIEEYSFTGCENLVSIHLPNSITSIGDSAFKECMKLESITMPEYLTNIGSTAFCQCYKLETVNIPENVTSIGTFSFASCSRLKSVYFPSSLTSIGTYAFDNCSKLESVYYNTTDPISCKKKVFYDDAYTNATLYVPEGHTDIFADMNPWKYFSNIEGFSFSGVDSMDYDTDCEDSEEVYDIDGHKVDISKGYPATGIFIIKNGKNVRKVFVK